MPKTRKQRTKTKLRGKGVSFPIIIGDEADRMRKVGRETPKAAFLKRVSKRESLTALN